MKFEALLFRVRVWILLALYLLGFLLPWKAPFRTPGTRPSTLWLASSTMLARTGAAGLLLATVTVTCFALACLALGAILRTWGTAHLSASVMRGRAMHGDQVVAGGPYRVVRNPLYLGSWLFGIGVSFLMPPAGALFFIIGQSLVLLLLIRGEERFLSNELGDRYEQYRRLVPRLLPRLTGWIPSSGVQPRWLESVMAEVLAIGYTLCFAAFAWRYNVQILLRCLLICLGASLILRGFNTRASR